MGLDDAYTKSLLHMNGADASTTFTDESGKTWTAVGNAQIDTAKYKFGGASGLSDGAGDVITTPNHADFHFSNGAFTFDGWVCFHALPANGGYMVMLTKRAIDSGYAPFDVTIYNNAGTYQLVCLASGGATWDVNVGGDITTPTLDTDWCHWAFVRSGNSWYGFWNGIQKGSTASSSVTVMESSTVGVSAFGNENGSQCLNGWQDEIRISKGIARWTGNFTPQTGEYGKKGYPRVTMI